MDTNAFGNLVEQQKKLLIAAKGRKGQKAKRPQTRRLVSTSSSNSASRPTTHLPDMIMPTKSVVRADLKKLTAPPAGHYVRQCFIRHSYPPSTTPFVDLKPITLSELRLETHHVGKVLLIRTFGYPLRILAIQNAVEDKNGVVERVAVYNGDPKHQPHQVLPKGTIFAIKEPFYKASADGGYIVRIDHPSDSVQIHPLHAMVPDKLAPRLIELGKDAMIWKKGGGDVFRKKDYLLALDAYCQGLLQSDKHLSGVKHDLLRNRAMCGIHLQRYEPAYDDAVASLVPSDIDDVISTNSNAKAHFRAGSAAYHLRDFLKAQTHFDQAQELTPDDANILRETALTKARLIEEGSGCYDFEKMSKSANRQHNRLDHASFTSKATVRNAGKKGRGLFATTNIKAGELVICEKAFAVACGSDLGAETCEIAALQKELQKTWGFKCNCTTCTAEASTPPYQHRQRSAFTQEVQAFLTSHQMSQSYRPTAKVIAQAENLYRKLEATYCTKAQRALALSV